MSMGSPVVSDLVSRAMIETAKRSTSLAILTFVELERQCGSWKTRVVHHHDECAVELVAYGGVVELLRGVLLGFAHSVAVFVAEGVCKLLHRLSERERKHVVDLGKHLCLALLYGCGFLSVGHHLAQLKSKLAQLGGDEA